MTPEEYDALKQEILAEERESNARDLEHEHKMSNDHDYILEYYAEEVDKAYEILREVCNKMYDYGWEETPERLLRNI